MITWEGLFSVFIFGLLNGGPAGLVYGFLLCWAGWAAVVATMGELVSMWPTAGGQYHWTYMLAPDGWKVVLSYITGWQSVIAWQALTASGAYLTATALQGLVVNSQISYVPDQWHGTLMVFALILLCFLFNTFLSKLLPRVETAVLALHILLFVVVVVVLAVKSPVKSSNAEVWATFLNEGGYESKGLSFFVGLITPVFAFSGADGAVHMSEEIKGSSRVVPWALMSRSKCIRLHNSVANAMCDSVYPHQRRHRFRNASCNTLLHRGHRSRAWHTHRIPLHRDPNTRRGLDRRRNSIVCLPGRNVLFRNTRNCSHVFETTLGVCKRQRSA